MSGTMTMSGTTRVLGGITVIDTPLITRALAPRAVTRKETYGASAHSG